MRCDPIRSFMPLKRNDRHDIDRRELKLIRVGHYLWSVQERMREIGICQRANGATNGIGEHLEPEKDSQTGTKD